MKKTRRQELKTNDLSAYLKQIYDAATRNATYLIGGVVVVMLVLVGGLWVQHNRDAAREAARKNYDALRREDAGTEAGVVDRARALAAEAGDDPNLGAVALELQGDKAYERALSLTRPAEAGERVQLLRDAEQTYVQLTERYKDRPHVVARARMSLAPVKESLLLAGQGKLEDIRRLYQELINDSENPYQAIAVKSLSTLDERIRKLEVVPAPASAPATATAPAVTTRPAATTVPAITVRPRPKPTAATSTAPG